jgi:uncharacterized membrane protein
MYGQPGSPPTYGQQPSPTANGQPGSPPAYGQYAPPTAYGQPGSPPAYGQYAPPPAYGQFSQMPPAPPGYGQYAPAQPGLKVGHALAFGWAKYKRAWSSWLVFCLVAGAIVMAFFVPAFLPVVNGFRRVWDSALNGTTPPTNAELTVMMSGSFAAMVWTYAASLVQTIAQVMAWDTGLREADGAHPGLGSFFAIRNAGNALLTGLIIAVGNALLARVPFVGFVGELAWSLFVVLAIGFAVDRNMSPFAAIGASFRLVAKNFGAVLLLMLAIFGINMAGAFAFGLGLFVTIPLSALALTYAFRRLAGGAIV